MKQNIKFIFYFYNLNIKICKHENLKEAKKKLNTSHEAQK